MLFFFSFFSFVFDRPVVVVRRYHTQFRDQIIRQLQLGKIWRWHVTFPIQFSHDMIWTVNTMVQIGLCSRNGDPCYTFYNSKFCLEHQDQQVFTLGIINVTVSDAGLYQCGLGAPSYLKLYAVHVHVKTHFGPKVENPQVSPSSPSPMISEMTSDSSQGMWQLLDYSYNSGVGGYYYLLLPFKTTTKNLFFKDKIWTWAWSIYLMHHTSPVLEFDRWRTSPADHKFKQGWGQGRKSEADHGGDIMFFSNRRQPIVAQLPKKLISGGGGGALRNFFFSAAPFWRCVEKKIATD